MKARKREAQNKIVTQQAVKLSLVGETQKQVFRFWFWGKTGFDLVNKNFPFFLELLVPLLWKKNEYISLAVKLASPESWKKLNECFTMRYYG